MNGSRNNKTRSLTSPSPRLADLQQAVKLKPAERRLGEIEFAPDEAGMGEAKPVVDAETQALLHRAQILLEGDTLEAEQAEELQELVEDIRAAESQEELDDLAEELLDMLFELE